MTQSQFYSGPPFTVLHESFTINISRNKFSSNMRGKKFRLWGQSASTFLVLSRRVEQQEKSCSGAGPVAEWLSLRALLQQPRVSPVQILAWTWYYSSGHAEAASHMPQLEGPTTKNTQLCTWGALGEKRKNKKKFFKKERWRRSFP